MRGLILALCLAFGAVAPLAGCASVQAVAPQSARQTLAAAEISFVGVITVTQEQVDLGTLSVDDGSRLANTYDEIAVALDAARAAFAVNDEDAAVRSLGVAQTLIRAASVELQRRAANSPSRPVTEGTSS